MLGECEAGRKRKEEQRRGEGWGKSGQTDARFCWKGAVFASSLSRLKIRKILKMWLSDFLKSVSHLYSFFS